MPTSTQTVRPLRVTTSLGPDDLLLVGLAGHEAISRLFQFHLDLMAENETAVPFEKLLGQKVTVELGFPDQDVRYLSGICCRVGQGGRDQTFTTYHLEVVPQFWFLTRIAQSRTFQQLTVPEILGQVLKGLDVDIQLRGSYEPRDYCVQYRETDFNFASRLMEEEGIFYFFRHTARGHTLVVADSPQSFPGLPESLIFDEAFSSGNRDEERIGAWEKFQELRSGKVTLWDHCFELPHKHLEAQKTIQDGVAAGTVPHKLKIEGGEKLELYDYPGEFAQRFDGVNPGGGDRPSDIQKIFTDNERTVALRMEEEAASGLVIRGSGNVRALISGTKFTLQGHFDADGSYLLTAVEHSARLTADYRSGDPDPYHYSASFSCIPAALPYRPARATPRPFVQGTQTAVVVGPPGEEIFTDKYSRVKVQFHWDRKGKNDASSSCWVRVGTPWAGTQWGMIHIPRIGQEVIVAFEEGDPDRPIIVGSVYNSGMMPPYALPANRTQSGVKSRSSLGGGPANFNEIRFEDKKGSEQLFIHAEKNQDIEVENDETHWVGHDRTKTIDHDETTHVKHDRTETVDNNETITIHAHRTETVDLNETITVHGNRTEAVDQNEAITVLLTRTRLVGINESVTVAVAQEITVGGLRAVTVGAAQVITVGASQTETYGDNHTQVVGGGQAVTVAEDGSYTIGGGRGTQVGKDDALKVAKKLSIDAGDEIFIKTGEASILMKKDGTIQIKGKNILVRGSGKITEKADGNIVIKGSKVGIN